MSLYWLGAMIGRFIGSAILQKLETGKVLGIAAVVAALLVCLSMLSMGTVAMVSIILVGLFNSIMFPSIFTLAIARVGAPDRRRIGLAGRRDCWRSHHSMDSRSIGGQARHPSRVCAAGDLLPVHRVLRIQGFAPDSAGKGLAFEADKE